MRGLAWYMRGFGESLSGFMRNKGRFMISTHTLAGSRWSMRETSLPMVSHSPAATPLAIASILAAFSSIASMICEDGNGPAPNVCSTSHNLHVPNGATS